MRFPDANPANPGCLLAAVLLVLLLAACAPAGHPVPAPRPGIAAVAVNHG